MHKSIPTAGPVASGKKEDLDAAVVYARAVLHAAHGPHRGELEFQRLPAMIGLVWWKDAWSRMMSGPVH